MVRTEKRRSEPVPEKAKNVGGRPKKARTDPGLVAAIEAAGSMGRLASIAGVTVGAVSLWQRIPQKAIASIAETLNIPSHTLRPDLYDPSGARLTKS